MDKADIEKIVDMARGRGVAEITVGVNGSRVRIAIPPAAPSRPTGRRTAGDVDAGPPAVEVPPALVRAPMVGIFRRTKGTPAPGAHAQAGSVVGEIESMGLRNEIVCEVGGRVTEAFVEDGQPVEYGQPIIAVALGPEEAKS
jgi:biotin carboxyl carrier protein